MADDEQTPDGIGNVTLGIESTGLEEIEQKFERATEAADRFAAAVDGASESVDILLESAEDLDEATDSVLGTDVGREVEKLRKELRKPRKDLT